MLNKYLHTEWQLGIKRYGTAWGEYLLLEQLFKIWANLFADFRSFHNSMTNLVSIKHQKALQVGIKSRGRRQDGRPKRIQWIMANTVVAINYNFKLCFNHIQCYLHFSLVRRCTIPLITSFNKKVLQV